MYAAIGVDTTWLKPRRMSRDLSGTFGLKDVSVPDLTLIVLSPSMTTRMAPPLNAMGLAATSETKPGRIAYVFYDRLRMVTIQCAASGTCQ
jgi:hypothetical protein